MSRFKAFFNRLELRHLLFLLLLFSGIIPLAISSFLLIRQNTELLRTEEKSYLARSSEFLSEETNGFLAEARGRLVQLGTSVLAAPGGESVRDRLAQPWIGELARSFLAANAEIVALRILDSEGIGPQFASGPLGAPILGALDDAFRSVRQSDRASYELVQEDGTDTSLMVVAVHTGTPDSRQVVVEAVLAMEPLRAFFEAERASEFAAFLIDSSGRVMWSRGSSVEMDEALAGSDLARESAALPGTQAAEYELEVNGETRQMLARVSPIPEAGWGLLLQKPAERAFDAARQMIVKTALSTAVLIVLALVGAGVVARRVSQPIQNLMRTSHEIALGNFGKRVEVRGPGAELLQLATDFNRMSAHVEDSVERLRDAAQENRELFIGSMRAFVAAIDAKDPYTRGHSERVAAHSRTVAKRLGMSTDDQHVIWVGALLHDVGKIGIDDRVLKKGGVLSDAEYEEMKLHPVIGAQIMSRIERLRSMIPAIRWHHESWGGAGYPDGLSGEQIPLAARIVAVADTFDAITTNRPYQEAYEPAFAVQRLKELAGRRFDAKVVSAFLQAFEAGEIQTRNSPAQSKQAEEVG
jgi:putative nucleotidyltransferase with HDIG domain